MLVLGVVVILRRGLKVVSLRQAKERIRKTLDLRDRPVQHLLFKVLDSNFGPRIEIRDNGAYESRGRSMRRLFDEAIRTSDYPKLKYKEFAICTDDRPQVVAGLPTFSFCDDGSGDWIKQLIPDFTFDAWPEIGLTDYERQRSDLVAMAGRPAHKNRVGWIGSLLTPSRKNAFQLGQENPDFLDIREVDWKRKSDGSVGAANAMSFFEQQSEWNALLDIAGHGWSARLKLLLSMGRVVIIQDRPWKEWWQYELIPDVHFVSVRSDLSNLVDVAAKVLEDDAFRSTIENASLDFSQKFLTREVALGQIRTKLLLQSVESPGGNVS